MIASREYVKDLIAKVFKSNKTKQVWNIYSTDDEQVVGQWIDGKPIYRRVFKYTNVEYYQSVSGNLDAAVDNLEDIIQMYGYIYKSSNKHYMQQLAGYTSASNIYYIGYNDDHFFYRIPSDYSKGTMIVFFEYTKTTD